MQRDRESKCDCFAFHLELKVTDFLLQVEIVGGQIRIPSIGLIEFAAQLGDLVFFGSQRCTLTLRQL